MAHSEHLQVLDQGVKAWNLWRKSHSGERPFFDRLQLGGGDLRRANLSGAYLGGAYLTESDLRGANLCGAILHEANLTRANLKGARLKEARLNAAQLSEADLTGADLTAADLLETDLREANLTGANLTGADLRRANLTKATLWRAQFVGAKFGDTTVANVDLSACAGLEEILHYGPSDIGIGTIYHSKGKIHANFLRDAGVPDSFIEYMASLTSNAFEYYSCFISYSSKDEGFAKRLHSDLQSAGVRCWFAPENMKIGQKIRPGLEEAIRIHDKLLLVLSEHSVGSKWVEKEVETAFDRETAVKTVLFPVRLDDAVFRTVVAWVNDIRRTRHIGDFTKWEDNKEYQAAFDRLLRDLKAKGKPEPPEIPSD